ncbi:hypothetical protein [Nocardia australiensis]|uniref:hypothetical protein n=1 Tax=Nocardia australiensis TaxID=2887191 RepID=UPI001D146A77|nr:hypothetical protein [Nocardia australiensis]
MFYLPVTLRGELVGYLWASITHNSASFLRKLPPQTPQQLADPFADPSLWSADVWAGRLAAAREHGMPAQQAVRQWIGAPEHPEGGHIPPGSAEFHAATLAALYEFVNPGGPPPPDPLVQDGMYPDGTPEDRSRGWGPLVSAPLPRYRTDTTAAIRFFPVTKDKAVIGYLWASVTGDAADYIPRQNAGRTGEIAAGLWQLRLSRAYKQGLNSLDALHQCQQMPPDRLSGIIGFDVPSQNLPTLAQLRELAEQ